MVWSWLRLCNYNRLASILFWPSRPRAFFHSWIVLFARVSTNLNYSNLFVFELRFWLNSTKWNVAGLTGVSYMLSQWTHANHFSTRPSSVQAPLVFELYLFMHQSCVQCCIFYRSSYRDRWKCQITVVAMTFSHPSSPKHYISSTYEKQKPYYR